MKQRMQNSYEKGLAIHSALSLALLPRGTGKEGPEPRHSAYALNVDGQRRGISHLLRSTTAVNVLRFQILQHSTLFPCYDSAAYDAGALRSVAGNWSGLEPDKEELRVGGRFYSALSDPHR